MNNDRLNEVVEYFQDAHHNLPTDFDLERFCEETGLDEEQAITGLCNLECDDTMDEICDGKFYSFDIYDSTLFNDCHSEMIENIFPINS